MMSSTTASASELTNRIDPLVGSEWLADHLDDPSVCLIEVDVSSSNFDEWHIDGAVLWNAYGDLKDDNYRLVDKEAIQELFERSGITPEATVVFYGYAPAMGFCS
jgi:thiosulfate/3-mercaptopyruvate sulfurtransferase